jgi:hypothetical protein
MKDRPSYERLGLVGSLGNMFNPAFERSVQLAKAPTALKALPERLPRNAPLTGGKSPLSPDAESLAGGLESGVRNITSESETPFLEALKSGALWGAGGGIGAGSSPRSFLRSRSGRRNRRRKPSSERPMHEPVTSWEPLQKMRRAGVRRGVSIHESRRDPVGYFRLRKKE